MRDSSDPPSLRMSLERNPYRESVASTKAAVWMGDAYDGAYHDITYI
jgi:hypothetical protein